ncbi:MAG: hypothetical protein AAGA92_11190 [Planctomycetota bacterium]
MEDQDTPPDNEPTASSVPSWQRRFEGREAELHRLKDAWVRVLQERQPIILPIVGATGVGKTRLVQQFYAWLSTEYDDAEPQGHWPDSLNIGRSLDYTPDLHDCQPLNLLNKPMPFLWWGARWHDPTERNRPAASGEGFEGSWPLLKAHAAVRLTLQEARDQRRQNASAAAESIVRTALAAVPWAELPLAVADAGQSIYKLLSGVAAERRLSAEALQRVQVALTALDQQFEQSVASAFNLFLRPNHNESPPAPAVLFLDDAQWARPSAVRLLGQLARGPVATGAASPDQSPPPWPVLILMTYWPDCWNEHQPPAASNAELQNPRDLLSALEDGGPVRVQAPMRLDAFGVDPRAGSELRPMIREALPGLTAEQLARLDAVAGGNPRLCVELLKLITSDQRMFVGFDNQNRLEESQLARLESFPAGTELYRVIQARLNEMPTIREALAAATLQGPRFLTELVAEVAEDLPLPPGVDEKPAAVRAGLLRAIDPEALAEQVGPTTCRFPEAIYFRVCNDYLREFPGLRDALARAVRGRLAAWVRDRREQDLSTEERLVFLGIAADTLDPGLAGDDEHAEAWQDALIRLLAELHAQQAPADLRNDRLAQLFTLRPPEQHAADWVARYGPAGIDPVFRLAFYLRPDDALVIAEAVRRHLQTGAPPTDAQSLRSVSISLERVGDAVRKQDPERALRLYEESMEIRRGIVERFGKDAQSLRGVAASLYRVGDAVRQQDRERALRLYKESMEIHRGIIERFGEHAQSLRDVSVSLNKVGDAVRQQDPERALRLYEESMAIRRGIVERFGEDAQSLRDVSISLERLGHAVRQQDAERALRLYEESMMICRWIVERFGEDTQSLFDLAVSLVRIGEIEATRRRACWGEAATWTRALIDRYGGRPDWVAGMQALLSLRPEWMDAADEPGWREWWRGVTGEPDLPPIR